LNTLKETGGYPAENLASDRKFRGPSRILLLVCTVQPMKDGKKTIWIIRARQVRGARSARLGGGKAGGEGREQETSNSRSLAKIRFPSALLGTSGMTERGKDGERKRVRSRQDAGAPQLRSGQAYDCEEGTSGKRSAGESSLAITKRRSLGSAQDKLAAALQTGNGTQIWFGYAHHREICATGANAHRVATCFSRGRRAGCW
jgi:hypothetical protein